MNLNNNRLEKTISNFIRHALSDQIETQIANSAKETDGDSECEEEFDVECKRLKVQLDDIVHNLALITKRKKKV